MAGNSGFSRDSGIFPTIRIESVLAEFTGETGEEFPFDGLLLVVLVALCSLAVEALLLIQQEAALVPYIAQGVNVEVEGLAVLLDGKGTTLCRLTYINVANALVLQELLHLAALVVGNLNNNAWVLCEENLCQVVGLYLV